MIKMKKLKFTMVGTISISIASAMFGEPLVDADTTTEIKRENVKQIIIKDLMISKGKQFKEMEGYVNKILSDPRLKIYKDIKRLFLSAPERELSVEEYVKKLVTPKRIAMGKTFMIVYKTPLEKAQQKYNIPKEMITAILGIESSYGWYTGKYDPVSVFVSMILYYPKRKEFAINGLSELLMLCKKHNIDPYVLKSSYAGCIGPGQFYPPTWKIYGVDGDNDGKINLMDMEDVIFSIANMLKMNGWEEDYKKALRSYNNSEKYVAAVIQLAKELGWTGI